MEISEILVTVGCLSILFGAFDFFSDDDEDLKQIAKKIIGGVLILGLGVALKKFLGL